MNNIQQSNYQLEVIDEEIIYLALVGDVSDDDYKQIWQRTITKMKETGITKFIGDQSRMGRVTMVSRAWFLLKALPKIKVVSLYFDVAIIPSHDFLRATGCDTSYQASAKSPMSTLNFALPNKRRYLISKQKIAWPARQSLPLAFTPD